MFFKKNDLPAALALCGEYASAFARGTCANGAYMENFNAEEQLHPSRYRNPADPFFPCDMEGLAYRADCYLYAPAYYLALHERDYEGALKLCAGAHQHVRAVCTQGVGSQAIKENIDDPLLVECLCDAGEGWQHHPRISGMIGLFANHHGELGPVEALCDQLRADNKAICVTEVQARRSFF